VFVGLAWAAHAVPAARRRIAVPAVAAVVLAAGAAWLTWGGGSTGLAPGPDSVWRTRHEDIRLVWGADTLRELRAEFGARYPRVAADTETSYYLAALEPVSVVAVTSQHTPFAVEATYGQRARDAMYALTGPGASEEGRRRILHDWRAEYVLVPKYRPDLGPALGEMRAERALLTPVVETPSVVLFRVAPLTERLEP
jgi:hypothetical protein